VSTCGTHDLEAPDFGQDTTLSIHSGCPATVANQLACNEDSASPCNDTGVLADATAHVSLVQGQTVYIRLSRSDPGWPAHPILLTVGCTSTLPFCFGDGSGTICPCGNVGAIGHGCDNSLATGTGGARMVAAGIASVSEDSLVLVATSLPPSAPVLFFQGNGAAGGGLGTVFADGLLCADGRVQRLGGRISAGGQASLGDSGASISRRGHVPVEGGTFYYQAYYRIAAPFCTLEAANLSNGVRVDWVP
jgi:hypothetical protein